MAKKINVKPKKGGSSELMSVGDIGKLCGVSSNTVMHWRARDNSFPKSVDDPTSGKLYRKGAVVKWLKSTGRMK